MDNFKLIYKILRILEKSMDVEELDNSTLSAESLGITQPRWCRLMKILADSGYINGINVSKRGSAIARRVIHTLTLQSISTSRTGESKNPVLRDYYLEKCQSKPKLVAMGAVSHKVCNMIFAILRDNKPFEIIKPEEHIKQYNAAKCDMAA